MARPGTIRAVPIRGWFAALTATAVTLASIACAPPSPPGTGVGEKVEVFVVGDSWAQLAGNPALESERQLPDGLGSVGPGQGALKPQLNAESNPAVPSEGRFNVVAYHPWGIGGSTAAGWAAGNPCATPTALGACQGIVTGRRGEITDSLMSQIRNVPAANTPLIYLSLGGNDLFNAGAAPPNGASLDLTNTSAVNAVLASITTNLNSLVARIVSENPRSKVVIAGYLALPATDNFPKLCQQKWRELYPAMTDVTQASLSSALVSGLGNVYQSVVSAHPQAWHEGNWFALGNPVDHSQLALDCIHLNEYATFVYFVIHSYVV